MKWTLNLLLRLFSGSSSTRRTSVYKTRLRCRCQRERWMKRSFSDSSCMSWWGNASNGLVVDQATTTRSVGPKIGSAPVRRLTKRENVPRPSADDVDQTSTGSRWNVAVVAFDRSDTLSTKRNSCGAQSTRHWGESCFLSARWSIWRRPRSWIDRVNGRYWYRTDWSLNFSRVISMLDTWERGSDQDHRSGWVFPGEQGELVVQQEHWHRKNSAEHNHTGPKVSIHTRVPCLVALRLCCPVRNKYRLDRFDRVCSGW